jgi:hypothetical protein
MKNYLVQGLGLTALVLCGLIALSLIPEGLRVGNFELRKMDIFYDIRSENTQLQLDSIDGFVPDTLGYAASDTLTVDSLAQDSAVTFGPLPPVDSLFFGSTIEDYTYDQSGLKRFYAAIDSIKSQGNTVRVAFYGDSFVEGDILIGDLRDTLQSLWGGGGVGFVPITSEVARFKRTLQHEYRGWKTFSVVKNRESKVPFGLNGFVYYPEPEAKVHYEGAKYFRHTQNWNTIRLFYAAGVNTPFIWQNKDMAPQEGILPAKNGGINVWKWELPYPGMTAFAMRFPKVDSLRLYGASLENGPGFYIDNFSVRGNTGGPLMHIRPDMIRQFDRYQQYDLIVIQVGLNAVTNSLNNINWYKAELDRTFDHLRLCFPNRPILVISVGDRGGKLGAELATMRSVPYIVAMQRDLARKHGFLFYDMFNGMGGPGTMIMMANQKPMLANKDYTHLTHDGGRQVGYMFARLFLAEQGKYRKSMDHY